LLDFLLCELYYDARIHEHQIWLSVCIFKLIDCGVALSSTLSQMICYASSQASINCLAFKPCTVDSVLV